MKRGNLWADGQSDALCSTDGGKSISNTDRVSTSVASAPGTTGIPAPHIFCLPALSTLGQEMKTGVSSRDYRGRSDRTLIEHSPDPGISTRCDKILTTTDIWCLIQQVTPLPNPSAGHWGSTPIQEEECLLLNQKCNTLLFPQVSPPRSWPRWPYLAYEICTATCLALHTQESGPCGCTQR